MGEGTGARRAPSKANSGGVVPSAGPAAYISRSAALPSAAAPRATYESSSECWWSPHLQSGGASSRPQVSS
ncbi:hypothetical protein ACWFR5_39320 [Streptomyces sp. NPDC055092]